LTRGTGQDCNCQEEQDNTVFNKRNKTRLYLTRNLFLTRGSTPDRSYHEVPDPVVDEPGGPVLWSDCSVAVCAVPARPLPPHASIVPLSPALKH